MLLQYRASLLLGALTLASCSGGTVNLSAPGMPPATSVTPPPALPSAIASGSAIISAGGGTLSVAQGSAVTVPAGVLSFKRAYTLSVVPSVLFVLGNTNNKPDGGAVTLETSASYDAKSANERVLPDSVPAAAAAPAPIILTLKLPSTISSNDEALVRVVYFDDSTLDLDFSGTINYSTRIAQVSVPAAIFTRAKRITLYDAKYVGPPDPPYGGRMLVAGTWTSNVSVKPRGRTLLLLHGIFSSVENGFQTSATAIAAKGSYDQVIGYDYDWTQPPDAIGPQIGSFINGLGLQTPIDVIAHSYGGVVAMAAIGGSGIKVDNLVTLGSPLAGSSLLKFGILPTIAANFPSFIGSLTKTKAAANSSMLDELSSNSPTLIKIKATMESASPPTRVIKVAGYLTPTFEKNPIFATLATLDLGSTKINSDGVVSTESALDPTVVGGMKRDPFAVSAPIYTRPLTFPDFHTSLEGDVTAQAAYIPLMESGFGPDGNNERSNNLLKGAGSYVYIWWSYIASGGPDTIIPSTNSLVTVDPASVGVTPTEPPPNVLPSQHVKYIATGNGSGFVSMPVQGSNSTRENVNVTVLPDCMGC